MSDPIVRLIEDRGGMAGADDFLFHMMSLSDVVKNDMKGALGWSEETINQRLGSLINFGLDENCRYRVRPGEKSRVADSRLPLRYTEAQCLLTEWLAIYRMIRIYIDIRANKAAA